MNKIALLVATLFVCLPACKSYMHGYTWKKAKDRYWLVTGDSDNFADRRLDYNKGFHRNSALSEFLDCKCHNRGNPSFIYEYQSESKTRGIRLYYPSLDSVFIFEEPKKGNPASVLKEARRMDEYERNVYAGLKSGK